MFSKEFRDNCEEERSCRTLACFVLCCDKLSYCYTLMRIIKKSERGSKNNNSTKDHKLKIHILRNLLKYKLVDSGDNVNFFRIHFIILENKNIKIQD